MRWLALSLPTLACPAPLPACAVVFVDDDGQEVEVVEVYDDEDEEAGAGGEAGPDEGEEGA